MHVYQIVLAENLYSSIITYNALFHISSQWGRTALHVASGAGQTEVVTLLLDHGADVHAVDKSVGGVCV